VFAQYTWAFALAWQPGFGIRFTMPHMGTPYMGEEGLINAAYATLFSTRNKGLHITGATDRNWLTAEVTEDSRQ